MNNGALGLPGPKAQSSALANRSRGFYSGSAASGSIYSAGNVTLGIGDDDANIFEAHYQDLTLNAGHILTVAGRRRAFVLRVRGNCIINGTLSMTGKGASAASAAAARIESNARLRPVLQDDLIAFYVPQVGGKGGLISSGILIGVNGGAGVGGSCGGGGSGGGYMSGVAAGSAGNGGDGHAYGGGAGGGGGFGYTLSGLGSDSISGGGGAGSPGGAGGVAGVLNAAGTAVGSGAGGIGAGAPNGTGSPGGTGVGGIIILIVGGNLTIGAAGLIVADGLAGGAGGAGGGGSGGGSILVLYGGSLSNVGTIRANGGAGGAGSGNYTTETGGNGGAGSIQGPTKEAMISR